MSNSKLSITLVDAYSRTTTKVFEIDDAATVAEYQAVATDVVGKIEDVTDCGVTRVDLVLKGIGAGFDVTPGANVDVGATFTGWVAGGNGKKASVKVPSIKPALVDPDGSVPLSGVVATWLAEYEEANDLYCSDGEHIDAWIRGSLDK